MQRAPVSVRQSKTAEAGKRLGTVGREVRLRREMSLCLLLYRSTLFLSFLTVSWHFVCWPPWPLMAWGVPLTRTWLFVPVRVRVWARLPLPISWPWFLLCVFAWF